MSPLDLSDNPTIVGDQDTQVFRCSCGKEFDVRGYPIGYEFACPKCHALCTVIDHDDELEVGTVFGDFVVERKIGLGGMGLVYLGRQLSLKRKVAIKVLRQSISRNDDLIRRFAREAQTAGQIIHQNIVQVYAVGEEKNTFFIAMEYVDGKSIKRILNEKGPIPEREAIDMVRQASCGLQRAHSMNILHRDVKPDNLMVNKRGEVKVADFGLALELGKLGKSRGPAGFLKLEGSPHYMSPEQALRHEVGFATDIYSLGATLYHMVTGVPPFTGNSPAAIMAKHLTDYPRSPREINARLSKKVCRIIQRMMAKRPEERFPNMEEVIDELGRSRNGRSTAGGVDNSHWFMEEREDTARLNDLMAIFEINKAIGQEKDTDRLLLRIVHEVTTAMNVERSTLYIYDREKDQIWAKVAEGVKDVAIIRLSLNQGIAGTAAYNLRAEVVNDVTKDPRFNNRVDAVTGFKTRSMICMPILGSGMELLGVIQVLNKKGGNFNSYDESVLSALAVQVGLALERGKYFCSLRPTCAKACNGESSGGCEPGKAKG
ncbi:MAG: protein kinase [Pseudomonadota bacterium]